MPSIEQYAEASQPDLYAELTSYIPTYKAGQMALYEFADEAAMSELEKAFIGDSISYAMITAAIDKDKRSLIEAQAGPGKAKFTDRFEYLETLLKKVLHDLLAKARKLGIEPQIDLGYEFTPPAMVLKAEEHPVRYIGSSITPEWIGDGH